MSRRIGRWRIEGKRPPLGTPRVLAAIVSVTIVGVLPLALVAGLAVQMRADLGYNVTGHGRVLVTWMRHGGALRS